MVAATSTAQAFDRGVNPVLQILLRGNVDAVLHCEADDVLKDRIDELAGKSTEGTLSSVELAEYEGYLRANRFLAILRRQAERLRSAGQA